jgi:hypothetical protein
MVVVMGVISDPDADTEGALVGSISQIWHTQAPLAIGAGMPNQLNSSGAEL